jgi:O-antigen/teichoic acid export membrane protein
VMLPAGTVAAIVLPSVFRAAAEQRARVALRITGFAVAITLVGGIAIEVFARTVVRGVFGSPYLPATTSLRVLGLATVVTAATVVLAQVHAVLRPGRLAKIWLIALAANVALNLVLIPRYAAAGAAWATLACQLVVAVILVWDTRHEAFAPEPEPTVTSVLS